MRPFDLEREGDAGVECVLEGLLPEPGEFDDAVVFDEGLGVSGRSAEEDIGR